MFYLSYSGGIAKKMALLSTEDRLGGKKRKRLQTEYLESDHQKETWTAFVETIREKSFQ